MVTGARREESGERRDPPFVLSWRISCTSDLSPGYVLSPPLPAKPPPGSDVPMRKSTKLATSLGGIRPMKSEAAAAVGPCRRVRYMPSQEPRGAAASAGCHWICGHRAARA